MNTMAKPTARLLALIMIGTNMISQVDIDAMKPLTRDEILEKLETNRWVVNFTKVNGDKRSMTCTLRKDLLPAATQADPLSQKKVRAVSEQVIPVWDLKKEGWRSFRIDSVIDMVRA